MHDQLKADGVAVGGVHDHRDGTASFYLRDPEGNWLEMLYDPGGFQATRGDGDPSQALALLEWSGLASKWLASRAVVLGPTSAGPCNWRQRLRRPSAASRNR